MNGYYLKERPSAKEKTTLTAHCKGKKKYGKQEESPGWTVRT
jgi:hypothetical protein